MNRVVDGWAIGKVALIAGGASGIGRGAAFELAGNGAAIVIADRDEVAGAAAVAAAEALGAKATFIRTDVTVEADTARMVDVALKTYGRLDMACNCAGMASAGGDPANNSVAQLERAHWESVIGLNLTGTLLCMKYEMRAMLAAKGGAIVNVSSTAGIIGVPDYAAYTASKHGVIGLTRAAALEVAHDGIRVNVVCPGQTETPMLDRVFALEPQRRDAVAQADPMGRVAQVGEIAAVISFLCSPGATFMTGSVVTVDGGWTPNSSTLRHAAKYPRPLLAI